MANINNRQKTKQQYTNKPIIIWIWTVTGTYLCICFKPLHVCFVPRLFQPTPALQNVTSILFSTLMSQPSKSWYLQMATRLLTSCCIVSLEESTVDQTAAPSSHSVITVPAHRQHISLQWQLCVFGGKHRAQYYHYHWSLLYSLLSSRLTALNLYVILKQPCLVVALLCHVKLLSSQHKLCVHHTTMHQFTVSFHSKLHR